MASSLSCLTPLDVFIWVCMKDQMYSQRVNTRHELKARITTEIVNVRKGMLQRVWALGGMYAELQMALIWGVPHLATFSLVCKKTLFEMMITLYVPESPYLFTFQSYKRYKSEQSVWKAVYKSSVSNSRSCWLRKREHFLVLKLKSDLERTTLEPI